MQGGSAACSVSTPFTSFLTSPFVTWAIHTQTITISVSRRRFHFIFFRCERKKEKLRKCKSLYQIIVPKGRIIFLNIEHYIEPLLLDGDRSFWPGPLLMGKHFPIPSVGMLQRSPDEERNVEMNHANETVSLTRSLQVGQKLALGRFVNSYTRKMKPLYGTIRTVAADHVFVCRVSLLF